MTPLFDRIDLASDAAFLLWVAGGMVAIGLAIGAYMVGRRAWRWAARTLSDWRASRRCERTRRERLYRRVEEQQERVTRAFRDLDKERRWRR